MWYAALVLLDVVGSGCGALRCRVRAVLAPYNDFKTVFDTQSVVRVMLYKISDGSLKRFLNYTHQVES